MDKIFIGCSSESLPIAQALQSVFKKQTGQFCIIWNQGVFKPQEYTIPALIDQLKDCEYAVLVFHHDDVTMSRGKKKKATRDNVIYECGLAAGILGLNNCFILKSKDVRLPSDFDGLTVADYDDSEFLENNEAAVGPAVTQFASCIVPKRKKVISWEEYMKAVNDLCGVLRKSPRLGGFRFDAIVGISRGGIIAADLISRRFLAEKPLFCLWGDTVSNQPEVNFSTEDASVNNYIFSALSEDRYKSILLVDDITRKGKTVVAAEKLLQERLPNKTIASAVLFAPKEHAKKMKYVAAEEDQEILMPYSVLD